MTADCRRGFSMVEVVVASVIFIMAAAGVLATIGLTSAPAISNESKVKAATLGKKVFDRLNRAVTSGIATGDLSEGTHTVAADPDFPGYTATYTVSLEPDGRRKVDVSVIWN